MRSRSASRRRGGTIVLALAVAMVVAATPACIGRSVPVADAPPTTEEEARSQSITDVAATLIVENERMVDYRIYLSRQGGERLGIVRGPGRARFLLRGVQLPHTGDLRVVAVPIAAREPLIGAAYVPRGRTARFRIMPNDAYIVVDPLPAPPDTVATDSTQADSTRADSTRKPPRR
jgi:hypothetical protein